MKVSKTLVEVKDLRKEFQVKRGFFGRPEQLKAVDGISFKIKEGETLSLVGESGCGKTTTGRLILKLTPQTDGQIIIDGTDVSNYSENDIRPLRENMQMIFQDPYASLNPRIRVRDLISEPLLVHTDMTKEERYTRAEQLLDIVGLNPEDLDKYAHEFSGGQRQRVGIARAISVNPQLIVADEPVSALDVSIRAQVLNLLEDLQEEFKLTYLFISHDLSVVEHISTRVCVMYLGKIVEIADRDDLYRKPMHPYTEALLSAVPIPNPDIKRKRIILEGDIPNAIDPPSGCRFHTRCPKKMNICTQVEPKMKEFENGRQVACHLHD